MRQQKEQGLGGTPGDEARVPAASLLPPMRVLIRVSAGERIGAGHAARTVSLGKALEARGGEVRWACEADAVRALVDRGVRPERIRVLADRALIGPSREAVVGPMEQLQDAAATLGGELPDWVVVDTYALGTAWHGHVRQAGARLLAFDDLCDRPLDADLVVNAAAEDVDYSAWATGAVTLTGLRYSVPGHAPRCPDLRSADLLVSFGASDPTNLTGSALEALRPRFERGVAGCRVIVQLGSDAPNRAAVESLVERLPWATLADGIARSPRMAIGAAGVSIQERMQDGIPSVVVCAARNQRRLLDSAVRSGAAVEARDPAAAASLFDDLWDDEIRLRAMSIAGTSAVDGRGALRIAGAMNRISGVKLRGANMGDAARLHRWRNHPDVRAVSHSAEPIAWESHVEWLNSSLRNEGRHILLAERGVTAVGAIRFDVARDHATVSVMVDPSLTGMGFGPAILDAGSKWVAGHLPGVTMLRAEVRAGNVASSRVFESCGYRLVGDQSDIREFVTDVQPTRSAAP